MTVSSQKVGGTRWAGSTYFGKRSLSFRPPHARTVKYWEDTYDVQYWLYTMKLKMIPLVTASLTSALVSIVLLQTLLAQTPTPKSSPPTATPRPTSVVTRSTTLTATNRLTISLPVTTASPISSVLTAPLVYVVSAGDSLSSIAVQFDVTMDDLIAANNISDPNLIRLGQKLFIPGHTSIIDPAIAAIAEPEPTEEPVPSRPDIVERLTSTARQTTAKSPFHKTTWLTYYGRPDVPVMGILGEYEIDDLAGLLQEKADVYDEANGTDLKVMPAFHLVYGMATKAPGDGSYLTFLTDTLTEEYIKAAKKAKFAVILDIQIGALTPAASLEYAFKWLEHEHVHLALDPEFAISYEGQVTPGAPAGYITAAEINDAQAAMQSYIQKNKIKGKRILLLHQFLDTMIVDKSEINHDFAGIEIAISVDGWGPPAGKISKYNQFVSEETTFSSFKLFYRWDVPVMSEREALGVDTFNSYDYIEVTPNMIIYQ